MKIKVTLERTAGQVDLVLTADADATVGDVADALIARDPGPRGSAGRGSAGRGGRWADGDSGSDSGAGGTLSLIDGSRVTLDPELTLADSGIKSGARIAVGPAGSKYADRSARPVARVTVLQGPDAGQVVMLPAGNQTIGRQSDCDVRLSDTLASRRHVRVFLAPGSAEFLDLGSANGLLLNDQPATKGAWLAGDRLQVGDTVLGIEFASVPGGVPPTGAYAVPQAAPSAFNRSPVISPAYAGHVIDSPELPESEHGQRFPLIALAAPVLMGGVLFAITRSPASLAFVALSPLMMIGNALESRWTASRGNRASMAGLRRELAALDEAARAAHADEWAARNSEHPPAGECLDAAARHTPLLWSRRPDAPRFLDVRAGTATLPSRLKFDARAGASRRTAPAARAALDEVTARYQRIARVPAGLCLMTQGSIGVAGDPAAALDATRALLCQLAALHSPAEVIIAGFCGQHGVQDWDWLKWLPHTSSAHSPLPGPHLAAGPESAVLLGQLEELARSRGAVSAFGTGGYGITSQQAEPHRRGGPAVIVLIDARIPADRARLVELSRVGPAAGIHCLWLAPRAEQLPAACTAYLDVRGDGIAAIADGLTGTTTGQVAIEAVDLPTATAFSRALSPLVDAGAVLDDDSDLPRAVSWLELTDPRLGEDPAAVIERWQESSSILTGPAAPPPGRRRPGTLRAVVGTAADGPHALDLRIHGPHALLGGTTGAGKSELLQTWILAMAAAHSPQRVNFLLVDYKGGSAFRDCVKLPHTVGLVTDLSPHLVRRALVSLSAELTYREHLLAGKKVKDLLELEKAGDPQTPPSLVIVVDEFAALVQEVPDFVDGVVNVAQRGRSLGLHLVLATQRPAGVIKDNLRANTNLRMALRVADEADSSDVLGSVEAAHIDPALPGRAVSKTGPGRLVPFQAAYVGGWTTTEKRRPDVTIEELIIGTAQRWRAPRGDSAASQSHAWPTDIQRITETIRQAARQAEMSAPRRPWLSELATTYDLAKLPTSRRDDELVFGVVDEPDRQRQVTAVFYPDRDGNLAIVGAGGTGKSTALRSLAIAAGFTVRGGPCQVYGIDFSSRGLDMLSDLPHVGAIIPADERDRVNRLLRTLMATVDDRARRYASVRAGTITDYRRLAGRPDEPRILVLLDGYSAFRQQYEMLDGGKWFEALSALAADGRPLGIHVVITADRLSALPARLNSAIQRRLIMRLADDNEYAMVGVGRGILGPDSPAGRAVLGGAELQVAVFGGAPDTMGQARAIASLGSAMRRQATGAAPRVEQLKEQIRLSELPATAAGRPVIGVADDTLSAIGFRPEGAFLITGPPGSGRTTAVATLVTAVTRTQPEAVPVFFGGRRSPLIGLGVWQHVATDPHEVAELAGQLDAQVTRDGDSSRPLAVVIEGINEFLGTPADAPLVSLIKRLAGNGHLIIAEGEVSALGGSWPLFSAVKSSRTGLALQPDSQDGSSVFKTDFPRTRRSEFPPGRGLLVEGGKTRLTQIAIPE